MKAIEVLLSHGVKEDRIIFLNLVDTGAQPESADIDEQIASPEGIKNVCSRFPSLRMVSLLLLFQRLSSLAADRISSSDHGLGR